MEELEFLRKLKKDIDGGLSINGRAMEVAIEERIKELEDEMIIFQTFTLKQALHYIVKKYGKNVMNSYGHNMLHAIEEAEKGNDLYRIERGYVLKRGDNKHPPIIWQLDHLMGEYVYSSKYDK